MANPVWPASLPQTLLLDGMMEQAPALTIRSQTSTGPAKVRRRTTAAVRPVQGRLILTETQMATFDAFYTSTIMGGALPLDWKHPRTGAAAALRIVEAPSYQPLGKGYWAVSLSLEILP